MATVKKSPWQSKTLWFGVLSVIIGATVSILSLLDVQGVIDLETGVWATVSGIITIILRYKTTIALAIGIDDPTTPEDESKGERAASNTGFVMARLLVLIAALSFVLVSLTGCAHLTPKEQEAVNASLVCASSLMGASQECVPECLAIAAKPEQKACAIACVTEVAEVSLPACAKVYGDIYSPAFGNAIRSMVELVFMNYRAVAK